MKNILFIISVILTVFNTWSQCDYTSIDKTNWSVIYFDSQEAVSEGANNGKAIYAIDGDTTTFWHTQWKDAQPAYPHEIQINLGQSYDVNGFSLLSRFDNPYGKPKDYEVYLSSDSINWNDAQSVGVLQYPNVNAQAQRTYVYFGSVAAKYIRFRFLTPYDNNYYTVLSEIDVYQSTTCPATGHANQLASFTEIPKKYTTDTPFQLVATTNSGLPISFEVVSGPASISGNTLTLNGTGGIVMVKAKQDGDATYYPWEETRTFEVVDLTNIQPEISVRFTENENIKMRELHAYPLYVYASIDEPDALNITSVQFEIDGVQHNAELIDNVFQYWWFPEQYGSKSIKVKATASNGMTKTETYTLNVSNSISDKTATTFNGGVIDMGTIGSQWYYGSYELPQFVDAYDKVIANFNISCPNVPGGCDDWDRVGWVEVKAPNGQWVELFRYITPYGVPCGDVVDVTDFQSILQGKVEFRMYIETWGTGGWKLNLKLDYRAGTPAYTYSSVEELWHGDYTFGNPSNLQPVPVVTTTFNDKVRAAKIRLTSTGHGWGQNNTANAAEFYHANHHIDVDGNAAFQQDLWQLCNPNPASCTGQQGTWQYDRAGWCPGSMGMVFDYDLVDFIDKPSIQLSYIFQEDYKDLCHPNNPNCISGNTCPDCNDTYNPYYRVGGYLIKYSNRPYIPNWTNVKEVKDIKASLYPNPTNGEFKINVNGHWTGIAVSIYGIAGDFIKGKFFNTEDELNQTEFNLDGYPSGMYFIKIQSEGNFTTMKMVKH